MARKTQLKSQALCFLTLLGLSRQPEQNDGKQIPDDLKTRVAEVDQQLFQRVGRKAFKSADVQNAWRHTLTLSWWRFSVLLPILKHHRM